MQDAFNQKYKNTIELLIVKTSLWKMKIYVITQENNIFPQSRFDPA